VPGAAAFEGGGDPLSASYYGGDYDVAGLGDAPPRPLLALESPPPRRAVPPMHSSITLVDRSAPEPEPVVPPGGKAANGQGIRLRPARGEHHIPPARPEARRNRLPRFFQNPPRGPALGMDRGWVARQSHSLGHGGHGFWAHGLGRIRVQV
jgi:hypothetical protein